MQIYFQTQNNFFSVQSFLLNKILTLLVLYNDQNRIILISIVLSIYQSAIT